MSEAAAEAPGVRGARSAGALLRAAREGQGMHLAALAAALKVPVRKIEALEADRLDDLPDAAFARALARSVCRVLKTDPEPVLALLPKAPGSELARVDGGLNEPFRERRGSGEMADLAPARHPLLWAGALLVALAVALAAMPASWWDSWRLEGRSAPPAVAASAPARAAAASEASAPIAAASVVAASAFAPSAASAPTVEVVHSAPSLEPAGGTPVAGAPGGVVQLRALEASWIEVVDAGGQVLLQRTLQPGESVGLDGRLPLRAKIGNAAATQVLLRGQSVDLASATQNNVARLELK